MEIARALVRPLLTVLLVGAAIYFLATSNLDAFEKIAPWSGMTLGFWFAERAVARAQNGKGSF